MKKETRIFKKESQAILMVAFVAIAALFAWAWQGIHAAVSQGISDSKNVRISKTNTCSPTNQEESSQKPHFSGCNSIL
ncbi:hypothetical protein ACFL6I_18160 [candidate division KSB1 bacterium]